MYSVLAEQYKRTKLTWLESLLQKNNWKLFFLNWNICSIFLKCAYFLNQSWDFVRYLYRINSWDTQIVINICLFRTNFMLRYMNIDHLPNQFYTVRMYGLLNDKGPSRFLCLKSHWTFNLWVYKKEGVIIGNAEK